MNLFLLRHGKAADRAPDSTGGDAGRPLTPAGVRKTKRVARGMRRLGLGFDVILASPYARSRRTAEIVAEEFGIAGKLRFTDNLVPDADPARLTDEVKALPAAEGVLLVGHEPFLGELVSVLLTGTSDVRVEFKKAGLCRLEVDELCLGKCATLHWLLTPRQLAALKRP